MGQWCQQCSDSRPTPRLPNRSRQKLSATSRRPVQKLRCGWWPLPVNSRESRQEEDPDRQINNDVAVGVLVILPPTPSGQTWPMSTDTVANVRRWVGFFRSRVKVSTGMQYCRIHVLRYRYMPRCYIPRGDGRADRPRPHTRTRRRPADRTAGMVWCLWGGGGGGRLCGIPVQEVVDTSAL